MARIVKERECGNRIPIKLFREKAYRSALTRCDPNWGSFFEKITVCFWVLPSSHQTIQGDALIELEPLRALYDCCVPLNFQEFGYVCLIV
ncbi:hypothetical protein FORC17_p045 (plasmid) [Vibrio vulnificus]|nr:hypothetical protein FORC17_p045 [Vibrio vulnificus]